MYTQKCTQKRKKQATLDAGKIAGFKEVHLINSPTAATLSYAIDLKDSKAEKHVIVIDMGATKFDVSLVYIDEKGIEVKASSGNPRLGGEDIENRLIRHFVKEFKRKHRKDISQSKKTLARLRVACERMKRSLSHIARAVLSIDSFYEGIDFETTICRGKFEDLSMDYFRDIHKYIENVLRDSKMSKRDIDDVILVGSGTRTPKIQQLISTIFNGRQLFKGVNPDEGIARGAALQAALLTYTRQKQRKEKGKVIKNEIKIPPKMQKWRISEINNMALDMREAGGDVTSIIPKNKRIPFEYVKMVSTSSLRDGIQIMEGKEGFSFAGRNLEIIGKYSVKGIKGSPLLKMIFRVDENGIFGVKGEVS